jgi:DNA-binding transcriptional MerR regulator
MYTVKEAAEIMNISAHTLRFYANNNLFPFITRDYNNIRQFSDKDLEWVKLVKCLRDTGMPIEGVKHYIDLCKAGDGTILQRFNMLVEQKKKALELLNETQKAIELIDYKVNYYKNCLNDSNADGCNPATGSLPINKPQRAMRKLGRKKTVRTKSA